MAETAREELNRLRMKFGSQVQASPQNPDLSQYEALRSNLAQGLTFGFADEVTAAFKSLGSEKSYSELRDDERAKLAQFKESYPGISLTGEILGSLLGGPGLSGLKAAQVVARPIAKALREGGVKKLAAVGAAEGGLYSAGTSEEDVINNPGLLGRDIATGAVTGAVVSPVLGRTASYIGRKIKGIEPRQVAAAKIIQDEFEAAGVNPNIYRQGGAEELKGTDLLADAPPLSNIVANSLGARGAQYKTRAILKDRKADERERVNTAAMDYLNTWDDLDPIMPSADTIIASRKDELDDIADLLYEKAYENTDIPIEGLFSAKNAKDLTAFERKAYGQARLNIVEQKSVEGSGYSAIDLLPTIEDFLKQPSATTRSLHSIKKAMDKAAYDRQTGNTAQQKLTAQFNKGIKEKNPDYVAANKPFEEFFKQKTAVDKGKKAFNLQNSQIKRYVSDLSDVEAQAFRSGMLQALNEKKQGTTASLADYVSTNLKIKEKVKTAFNNDEDFSSFMEQISSISRQNEASKILLGGSQTAIKTQADKALDAVATTGEAAAYSATFAIVTAMTSALKNVRSMRKDLQKDAVNKILVRYPGGAQAAFKAMDEYLSAADRNEIAQIIASAGAGYAGSKVQAAKGLLAP